MKKTLKGISRKGTDNAMTKTKTDEKSYKSTKQQMKIKNWAATVPYQKYGGYQVLRKGGKHILFHH